MLKILNYSLGSILECRELTKLEKLTRFYFDCYINIDTGEEIMSEDERGTIGLNLGFELNEEMVAFCLVHLPRLKDVRLCRRYGNFLSHNFEPFQEVFMLFASFDPINNAISRNQFSFSSKTPVF
jgi:hypothetical protein